MSLVAGLTLGLLAGASSVHAQPAPSGSAGQSSPALRPEEVAADELLQDQRPQEALTNLARAATAYRQAKDDESIVRVVLKASRARISIGDFAGADAALREALPIAERTGNALVQSDVLRALAVVDERLGRQREALEHFRQAVSAADRSGDADRRIRARNGAAAALLGLSRYDEALATAQDAYEIADRPGVPPLLRAVALFALAQANAHIWNLDRAAELWPATIDAYRDVGSPANVARALKQSVETWFALGDFDRAVAVGEQAVAELRQTRQLDLVAETEARVALSELRRGRAGEARQWAARARADLATAPESRHLFVHNDLGIVESEVGDLTRARADFARVLDIARRIGNIEYEWRASWGEGRAALRDAPNAAVAPLERAIASVERLRQTIPDAGLRASFMINRVGPFETLVDAHMASVSDGRPSDGEGVRRALEVAERARSRALADLLAEARARNADARLAAIRDEETAFGGRFTAVQQRITGATDAASRAAALRELQDLEREYETLLVRIRRDNPAYASLAYPRSLSAAEIAATLEPDEALVEFLITEKQGYAWVVHREAVRGYRVPGARALDRQVRLLSALLAARNEGAIERLAAQLHATLLGPAAPILRDARRLVIVADGVLLRLPFALLRSNDRWLVETHTIAMAPSATILQFLRQARTARVPDKLLALAAADPYPGHLAIFGDGLGPLRSLTHVTDEVRDVVTVIGAAADSARTGAMATEAVLKSPNAARHQIVHLAAHAVADEIVPRRSAVLLSPGGGDDGLLQVNEIANLSLNADLVVLAACHSNVGRLVRGEGLLSLSRAFMHAGARAVVASAWAIPDRETAWLMRRFYAALGDGLAPADALRRAQLDALESGGSRSAPGVWAAFVVFGDARSPILDPVVRRVSWTWLLAPLGVAILLGYVLARTLGGRRRTAASPHAEAGGR
jgi:CHAT domain-containing protein